MKTVVNLSGILILLLLLTGSSALAQTIFGPEGMNIPGSYDGWSNPPTVNAIAGIQKVGGTFLMDSLLATRRYTTVIHVDASGADLIGGAYQWLFTSGPSGGEFSNKWGGVTVSMDNIQNYSIGGADNNVTLTDGKYYTVNFKDVGYTNTTAIWIETATLPVAITSVTQSPPAGSVPASTPVTVTVVTNDVKSSEENVYVRYSTDNFSTSSLATVSFVGTSGTASIPGQSAGTTVKYYAFSTKATSPSSDHDMLTLRYRNNNGANYSYTIPAPNYNITATAGPNGSISPSGSVSVASGGSQMFTMTPSGGYYVDSVFVDNAYIGNPTTYTFTNVTANHSIHVVFAHNVNITFRVNLSWKAINGAFVPDSDIVLVRGTFNGYGTTDTLRDLDGDTIYTGVISLKAGTSHEYKFYKSLRAGLAWEDNISNRQYTVGQSDATLPIVFFDNDIPPTSPVLVTFQVDMRIMMLYGSMLKDSGDVVTVRGSFNDWGNSTNNPDTLYDPENDSIYSGIFAIPGNQTIQYKFWKTLRDGKDYESSIPDRSFDLSVTNATLPVVFFDNDSVSPWYSMNVANKWNLLSVPRKTTDPTPAAVFPTATSQVFGFNGAYFAEDSLEIGIGYWAKFPSAQAVPIFGHEVLSKTIDVTAGWNMIGGLSRPLLIGTVGQSPPGNVASGYFRYRNGYQLTDTLEPGLGYFVKVTGEGSLTLNASAAQQKGTLLETHTAVLKSLASIEIEDAAGYSQTLYYGVKGSRSSLPSFELPPAGPGFDARFASGTMAELGDNGAKHVLPIQISSAAYPVTIRWSGGGTGLLKIGGRTIAMRASGSARLSVAGESVSILTNDISNVPETYALSQNFPNPFNPATSIEFGLPVESRVVLKVYNLLGQELETLVNEDTPAGWHRVEWDAAKYSSGLYFYRLSATSATGGEQVFNEVRKMILSK